MVNNCERRQRERREEREARTGSLDVDEVDVVGGRVDWRRAGRRPQDSFRNEPGSAGAIDTDRW